MISHFSIISAALVYSCMLFLVSILRRITPFMKRGGVPALLLLSSVAVLRLILPFEIPVAYTYQSWDILGGLQLFLRAHPTATEVFLNVWKIGAVIVVGWSLFDLCRAYRQCREYTVVESELVKEIINRNSISYSVVVSPDVEVPYVAGFFRCTIYLPVAELKANRLELAILHEVQHIRSHDALYKLLFGLVMAAMWWNPVIYLFWGEFDTLLEMRCDARVTAGMSDYDRMEYAEMLKDVAKLLVKRRRVPALALNESAAVGRKGKRLLQRADVVTAEVGRAPLRNLRAVAQCLVLALFCASYFVVFQSAGLAPAEKFEEEPEVYYEENYAGPNFGEGVYSAFVVKGADGRYQLCINYEFIRYLTEDEVASDEYKNFLIIEESRER